MSRQTQGWYKNKRTEDHQKRMLREFHLVGSECMLITDESYQIPDALPCKQALKLLCIYVIWASSAVGQSGFFCSEKMVRSIFREMVKIIHFWKRLSVTNKKIHDSICACKWNHHLSLMRVWVPLTLLYRVKIHKNKCVSNSI